MMLKSLQGAGKLCMIDGETFSSFTKNMWIRDLVASCHITNYDINLYIVTNINKLVQGTSGSFLF